MANEIISAYLEGLCRKLKLPKDEKEKIEASVKVIRDKLISEFFDDGLKDVRVFGSFDRGTLLSRKVDESTDVDILVIFDKKKFEAQTYLTKLKKFAQTNYPRSDSYQDHPTIVVELNHITFELVPCIYTPEDFWDYECFKIPKRDGDSIDWIETKPDHYKNKIQGYSDTKEILIKLLLLFKYWNLVNDFPYSTFQVERFVMSCYDSDEDLLYNFYNVIDNLNYSNGDEQNKINKQAKEHIRIIKLLIENNREEYAEMELNILLPEIEN